MIDKVKTSKYLKVMRPLLIVPLVVLLLAVASSLPAPSPALAGSVQEANAGRGGEILDLRPLVVPGRVTLIDFYSPYCPPCRFLAPLLEQLAQRRPDLVVKKVNINRPGFQGIDWKSPLAQQYQLKSVPYFLIFNPRGKLMARGNAAMQQFEAWLKEAGIPMR